MDADLDRTTLRRSMNLNPVHDEAWERLAAHAGLNKNQFMRWVLLTLSTDDVDRMFNR